MVTGEYPPVPGGVGDYTRRLSRQLAEAGCEVTVLTRGFPVEDQPDDSPAGPVVMRSVRGWGFGSWPAIVRAANSTGAQLIHLQYQAAAYRMHPASNLIPAYLRLSAPEVKIVTTFHDLRVPYLFPKAGRLRQAAVGALDTFSHASILTNSADMEKMSRSRQPGVERRGKRWLIPIGSNIDCCPPSGFDRGEWRRGMKADSGTLLLSYFGFMNDSKGVAQLVEALALLVARGVNVRLVIVGGGTGETDPSNLPYAEKIRLLIDEKRLQERVTWTGFLPPEGVSAALLSSDLCVLPFRDGASLRRGSLLAALVHGLPVVTTYPTHDERLLLDGTNVAMTDRDNPSATVDAVELLWHDSAARARLASGALALSSRFSWKAIAARHMELYEELRHGDG